MSASPSLPGEVVPAGGATGTPGVGGQSAAGGRASPAPCGTVRRQGRRSVISSLPLSLVVLAGCGSDVPTDGSQPSAGQSPAAMQELVLLVASSLTEAVSELTDDFSKQPGLADLRFTFSFGASSQLRMQLEQGAPADLFASADAVQMEHAERSGAVQGGSEVLARNRLVLIVPRQNRAGVTSLADLARPGLKLVTTPTEVPIGSYTRQALDKMSADAQLGEAFKQRVLVNVVSEEVNVRQVVTKVQLGEADAGIVYASDITPRVAQDVRAIEIPERLNVPAEYRIAVTRHTKSPDTARRFIEHARGPAGQAILKKHNFLPPA